TCNGIFLVGLIVFLSREYFSFVPLYCCPQYLAAGQVQETCKSPPIASLTISLSVILLPSFSLTSTTQSNSFILTRVIYEVGLPLLLFSSGFSAVTTNTML